MRHDLAAFRTRDDLLVSLRMLVERRKDLVADRTRSITRLRSVLVTVFPGLERALRLNNKGPLVCSPTTRHPRRCAAPVRVA